MGYYILIRTYKPGDELNFRDIVRDGVISTLNSAFIANLFKEITFQLIVLLAAIMFIFFGMPCTICLFVIPLVAILIYVGTYIAYATKAMEVDQEIANIQKTYMANAFSNFWVAEAYEPYLMNKSPRNIRYTIMNEKQFKESQIKVDILKKRIVGTIGLSKSHRLDKGAWIKRLCVHRDYRRQGIASTLLQVAIQFAIEQGYNCVDIVASEHTEAGRLLCLKRGFELKQMYHKPMLGSLFKIIMYELTYQIKPETEYYFTHPDPVHLI